MNFKRFETQVPSEYQELTFIANSGTQYIDTGLKGSDLADCELEIVMRNNTITLTAFNYNGTYLAGSTAQLGLVATSSSECRSSMNFGFADAISTAGLNISEFHTIYATDGLQKVDNTVVGTLNFGTLNNGNFLLFARTDLNQTSAVNICAAMSLKSFTVKRNNQYIRNMIPVQRKSDNTFGLYDTANGVFYTNQGTGDFTGGTVVEPTWQDIPHYIHNTSTDTITTLPADIYANDNNATVGLKGDMSQTGTPTPTTPIQPSECGEMTGNLFGGTFIEGYQLANNTGLPTPYTNNSRCAIETPIDVTNINTVTFSFKNDTSENKYYMYSLFNGTTLIERVAGKTSGESIDVSSGTALYLCVYTSLGSVNAAKTISEIMLNTGSTPQPYEPYGYKIPISSANTTTPVYLGEVQSTRRIYKFILDGTEDWKVLSSDNSKYYLDYLANDYLRASSQVTYMCTHYIPYEQTVSATLVPNLKMSMSSGNAQRLYIADTNFTTTDQFKTYLQQQYANGTPVTVWYILATPTTGIVNEPLRKIGDYADTVSGITIPTTTGKDTFDVQTILKPSEVSLTYTGWHDASVKEWDGSEWQ